MKKILLVILILMIVFTMFIYLVSFKPKLRINSVAKKITYIDSIENSNNHVIKQTINYKNHKNILTYNVSNSIKETYHYDDRTLYSYSNNDIYITVCLQELNLSVLADRKEYVKNYDFIVNNREYSILINGPKILDIYTKINSNLYYTIQLDFFKEVSISKKELENLKPFFDITFD